MTEETAVLAAFAAAMTAASLFALTVSGMLPKEYLPAGLSGPWGRAYLYGSMAVVLALTVYAVVAAFGSASWYFVVMVGGFCVLVAPLIHQVLPRALADSGIGTAVFLLFAVAANVLLGIA